MRKLAVSLTLLGTMLLLVPSGALAQEDGVVVDPNSPAGKEYAIPFDQARKSASGGRGGDASGSSSSRFGEGVEKGGKDGSGSSGKNAKGKDKQDTKDSEANDSIAPAAGDSGSSGGGDGGSTNSAALLTGGIALAVLLIGGALALMTRRTPSDEPSG